jgi:hypothetical protein
MYVVKSQQQETNEWTQQFCPQSKGEFSLVFQRLFFWELAREIGPQKAHSYPISNKCITCLNNPD